MRMRPQGSAPGLAKLMTMQEMVASADWRGFAILFGCVGVYCGLNCKLKVFLIVFSIIFLVGLIASASADRHTFETRCDGRPGRQLSLRET